MSRHPRVLRESGHCRLTSSVKTARHPVRKSCTLSQSLSLLKREQRSLWWPNQVCIHVTCMQRAAIIKNKRISIADFPTWLTSSFHRREAADSEAAPAARHGPTETGGEGTQGRAESPWQWRMWGGWRGGGRYDRWFWGRRGQNVCLFLAALDQLSSHLSLCIHIKHNLPFYQGLDELLGGDEGAAEEEEEGSVAQSVRSPSPAALNGPSPTPYPVSTDGTLLLFPGNSCSRTG